MSGRRAAIITGAATGVGAACAEWLARRDYDVLINYNSRKAEADAVADRCAALGADAQIAKGDISIDANCRAIAEAAERRWGRVDVLINCAGTTLFRSMADLDALSEDDFTRIYAVNAVGPYLMTRAVASIMGRTRGSIVNISSIAGVNGTGSSYAYVASKGALNTLTLALARNLAPRIRVNAVMPGMIEGGWMREGVGASGYEKTRDSYVQTAALEVICTPEQIAEVACWLATATDVITGQLVTVDAGLMLGRAPRIEL